MGNLKMDNIDVFQSQLIFIEDVLITKALLNKQGKCEFVTYAQAPASFKIIDYAKENNSFFGCIVMVSPMGFGQNKLVERYHFNKIDGFQLIGHPPGTTALFLESQF